MKVLTLTIMAVAATVQASVIFGDSARGSDSEASLRPLPTSVHLPHPRVNLVKRKKEHRKPEDVIAKCALPCIEYYVLKHTMCELDNWKCICKHHEVKDSDAMACFVNHCGMTNTISMFLLPGIHNLGFANLATPYRQDQTYHKRVLQRVVVASGKVKLPPLARR